MQEREKARKRERERENKSTGNYISKPPGQSEKSAKYVLKRVV
jgi:hypothetical protein